MAFPSPHTWLHVVCWDISPMLFTFFRVKSFRLRRMIGGASMIMWENICARRAINNSAIPRGRKNSRKKQQPLFQMLFDVFFEVILLILGLFPHSCEPYFWRNPPNIIGIDWQRFLAGGPTTRSITMECLPRVFTTLLYEWNRKWFSVGGGGAL